MSRVGSLKTEKKLNKHLFILLSIFCGGLVCFAIILLFTQRLAHSDDYVFQTQIQPYHTLFDWLNYRYHTWSGRIFAESFVYIFSPLPLIFWKVVSFILYAVFSVFIFMYYLLFTARRTTAKDYFMMALALVLPLLMDTHAIADGMLWVTGAMNYFWLSAFALVAFYPYCYYAVHKHAPHWLFSFLALPSAVIAASSQEQIGATLVIMSVLFTGYALYHSNKTKAFPAFLSLTTLSIITSFVFAIKAPGNLVRLTQESSLRLPDFYTIPLLEHIEYAYRWFIDYVINRMGLLLALVWLLLLILFAYKKMKSSRLSRMEWSIASILAVSLLLLCFKGFEMVRYWFIFFPTWKAHAPHITLIALIPWTLSLIASLIAPITLFGKRLNGYVYSLLVGATLATIAIVALSPTMYASGVRVLYVPSVILVLLVYLLFDKVFDHYKKPSYFILASICLFAMSQYGLLVLMAIHKTQAI